MEQLEARCCIVGGGPAGVMLGYLLARAGVPVTLIGRKQHVDAINRDGLTIDGLQVQDQIWVQASTEIGAVHHVAFASTIDDHAAWGDRLRELGHNPTPVIDRFYFRSIYFREPGGVLFEIATIGPGFTADEPLLSLGEHLSLPPDFEHLRERIEPVLTPLPDIRAWRPETT